MIYLTKLCFSSQTTKDIIITEHFLCIRLRARGTWVITTLRPLPERDSGVSLCGERTTECGTAVYSRDCIHTPQKSVWVRIQWGVEGRKFTLSSNHHKFQSVLHRTNPPSLHLLLLSLCHVLGNKKEQTKSCSWKAHRPAMFMKPHTTVSGSKLSNVITAWKWVRKVSISESHRKVKDPKVIIWLRTWVTATASLCHRPTKIQCLRPPRGDRLAPFIRLPLVLSQLDLNIYCTWCFHRGRSSSDPNWLPCSCHLCLWLTFIHPCLVSVSDYSSHALRWTVDAFSKTKHLDCVTLKSDHQSFWCRAWENR